VNSRLDELQAAILRVRLRDLDAQNARRAAIAARYDAALAGAAATPPWRAPGIGHVFHQYVLRCPARDAMRADLGRQGIDTAIHYPVPVHLQPAYAGRLPLGPSGCAASAAAAHEILSLPMFPELSTQQIDRICAALAGC
jgi:dTDP-4-amino-4,6-dideoxygalactose transaminase